MARKPAAPRRGASKSASRQRLVPGWVWLFTGVVAGLFIAFLFHLGQLQLDREARPATAATESKPESKPAEESRGPRFDFYAVLPQMEVIMPKGEDDPPRPERPSRTPPPDQERTVDDDAPIAHRQSEHFLLQAGSFRRSEDADRRRAELILQGMDARVQPVSLDSGDTWHRVMIGPFTNANAMHRVQDQLVSAGIETLAIRVRDPDA